MTFVDHVQRKTKCSQPTVVIGSTAKPVLSILQQRHDITIYPVVRQNQCQNKKQNCIQTRKKTKTKNIPPAPHQKKKTYRPPRPHPKKKKCSKVVTSSPFCKSSLLRNSFGSSPEQFRTLERRTENILPRRRSGRQS